jgi:hypothetical protein
MPEVLIYVIRPDNTALWLPPELMDMLELWEGEKLTEEQFNHPAIQQLLEARRVPRKKP